jgi:phage terminase large subunit-like protein
MTRATRSRRRAKSVHGISRAERNIRWVERYCRIPEGKFVGKPLEVAPYMREDFRVIYDNPAGTRTAIITRGRKNAKTVEAALILLLHLCGPEARPNSQLNSAAQSRDQAAILFSLAAKMVRLNTELSAFVTIRDTAKQLLCPQLGTVYRALSADATTAYGLSPALIVFDELGQVRGPRSELYEALETATAAQEQPLSVIISTQAPTDADLLSVLIDKAAEKPRCVLRMDTAPLDMDPFSEEAIRIANPAFDYFMNKTEILDMAENARLMPSREAEFRNLVLNQRVEARAPFISRSAWQDCGAAPRPIDGVPVYGGLDLSAVSDLTALVLIGKVGGVWQVHPTFWLPAEGLAEKARTDRVPYDMWAKSGALQTAPGKAIDYEFVAAVLAYKFREIGTIRKIGFDRWAFRFLRPWLLKAGFTESDLTTKFEEFGQGFQSMSPALRDLETEILNKRIAHGNHPVLAMCAGNAVVRSDPAGGRKLDKDKSTGRIDGMIALTMAMGVAPTFEQEEFVTERLVAL